MPELLQSFSWNIRQNKTRLFIRIVHKCIGKTQFIPILRIVNALLNCGFFFTAERGGYGQWTNKKGPG